MKERAYSLGTEVIAGAAPGSVYYRSIWLWSLLLLAAIGIRWINLGADPPFGLPDDGIGLYVDEGYKTLSARNLVLFDKVRWHPEDQYRGWHGNSPMTHGAFWAAFSTFGISLESARIVSILWFGLLLSAYLAANRVPVPASAFWTGYLLLAFEHVMWVLSRVALLEIAAISVLFGTLLVLPRFARDWKRMAVAFAIVGIVAAFGIKKNAAIVVMPALFGIAASHLVDMWSPKKCFLLCLALAVLCLIPVGIVKLGVELPYDLTFAMGQVDFFPVTGILERFLVHPVLLADPFVVILTHACALGLVLHRPDAFRENPYRWAIVSIALLGTAMFALMGANVIRHYVLILPAFILVAVEWWTARREVYPGKEDTHVWRRPRTLAAMFLLVLLLFDCLFLFPWAAGTFQSARGPWGASVWIALLLAAGLGCFVWSRRELFLTERTLRGFVLGTLIALAGFNSYKLIHYLSHPTWQVRTISNELSRMLPEDAVIAGDWSPLFGLETKFRVLYMNLRPYNHPDRIQALRPTHFLYSESKHSMESKRLLEQMDGVSLGTPLLESEYNGFKVVLYPLTFEQP